MVNKSYCLSFHAAVMLGVAASLPALNFLKGVTLSLDTFALVAIDSCTINHFILLVVIMRSANIIVARTSRYCFYFVTI